MPLSTFDIAKLLLSVTKECYSLSYKDDAYEWTFQNKKIGVILSEDHFRYFIQNTFVKDIEKGIINITTWIENNNQSSIEKHNKESQRRILMMILVILKDVESWKYIVKDMELITRITSD